MVTGGRSSGLARSGRGDKGTFKLKGISSFYNLYQQLLNKFRNLHVRPRQIRLSFPIYFHSRPKKWGEKPTAQGHIILFVILL